MKTFLCVVALLAAALTAPAANDLDAIQGTWLPVKAELAAQPLPDDVLKTIVLKIENKKWLVTVAGKPDKGTWSIDPSTSPKAMTIVGVAGPNAGKTFPCIYELKDDTLRVCYDLSGVKRPTEFKTVAGTKLYLVTYKRQMPPA